MICILFAFIACSCDDDDDIFSANSVERVEAVIADCDAILKTPAQGWHAVYVPNPELTGAFNILMKFDEGGMVRMDGDFVENESYSAYSYNSSKGPVLCFDTYAAIHALADPTGEDSRLKPSGLEGDFEFIIKSVSADSVVLIGKKREQKLVLYPATADQWTVLLPNAREYLKKFSPKANAEFFRILTIADGAESINLVYDSLYRSAAITWADHANRSTETFTTAILGTESGVAFRPALEINGYKVSRLNYDAVSGLFKIDESADGIRGELKYMNEPPFPFYDSYTSLLENTNAGVTPLVGQMDLSMYGLMELLKVFSNSNEFSEEFRSSYSSAVLTGLKQFKLAS